MTNKDREAFEAFVRRGTREGEDFLERDSRGDYLLGVARGGWASWQAARDHYAPQLTEREVEIAVGKAIISTDKEPISARVMKALRAAGLRFKEEA